ncbi:MAG: SulP family inorganic anion transporter, partial [Solirubrobacteraceae bacterium]|nr:SulP family inorganic anion transporter [Solirubrobacteraceae bacterium]
MLPQAEDWAAVRRAPRRDLIAGSTVAVVALPLALAFGVSSGLGAEAGLITAIVGGFVAAIFGGSNLQVSGPTGAMTVVLIPIVHQFGPAGALTAGFLAGVILIGLAAAKVGRYVRFLPLPVIEGFTAGIAVVIALQQVPAALGLKASEDDRVLAVAWDAVSRFAQSPDVVPIVMALAVAATMLVGVRLRPGLPFALIAVALATALSALLLDLPTIGALPAALPAPSTGFFDAANAAALLPAAAAIAALAALESLLSATVADGMTVNERHDPDRELFGQGLANLAVPLFGGVPATAAIARTAVNVRAGAGSRLAAASHAVILAAVVLIAAPLVASIPLAALAGVLLATTARMVDPATLRGLLRSTRGDAAILVSTFLVTVTVDLITAVGLGVALAMIVALRNLAKTATFDRVEVDRRDHTAEEHRLLNERIVAFRPAGPLFFGAASRFLTDLTDVTGVDAVVLRLSAITTMDATGAAVLGDAIEHLERRGIPVLVSGITDDHHQVLTALGATARLNERGHVFPDTPSAIAYAREHLVRR